MYNVVLFLDEGTLGVVRETWFSLGSDVSFIIAVKLPKLQSTPPPPPHPCNCKVISLVVVVAPRLYQILSVVTRELTFKIEIKPKF